MDVIVVTVMPSGSRSWSLRVSGIVVVVLVHRCIGRHISHN